MQPYLTGFRKSTDRDERSRTSGGEVHREEKLRSADSL